MAITRACIDWFRSKFTTEFQHVTANTVVQGQRVKGQGHSVRNRQHRFTAKSVGLSYLFNLSDGRGHGHVAPSGCQVEVHKTSENTIFSKETKKTQNVWRHVVRPLRCNAFAITRFLVIIFTGPSLSQTAHRPPIRLCTKGSYIGTTTHCPSLPLYRGVKNAKFSPNVR